MSLDLYNVLTGYLYRNNVQWLGSSALLWAAKHGREATAEKSLNEGADIHSTDFGRTSLFLAALNGHKAVIKLLLGKGAEVDAKVKDGDGRTPLLRYIDYIEMGRFM